jgi:hypothetical protein
LRDEVHVWQKWSRWLLTAVFGGEDLIILNMDETAIRHEYSSKEGNVIHLGRRACAQMRWCEEKIAVAETRAHCTLVAFVSNYGPIQRYLPQIFLPASNKRPLSAAEEHRFRALPAPVEHWTGSGGWVTAEYMKKILTAIRRAVRGRLGMTKILLWIDCASQHVSVEVLNHAARLQIYLLLVPASLTWLMQPLDVYVFAKFKATIRELQRVGRKNAADHKLPAGAWITLAGEAIQKVLVNTDWSEAFSKLGLGSADAELNKRLAPYMLNPADVIAAEPTDEEIELLIGRHRVDVARHFVNGPRRVIERRGAASAAEEADDALLLDEGEPVAAHPVIGMAVPPVLRLRRLPSAVPPPLPPPAE